MPRLFFLNEEGSNEQSETLHLKKNTTLCKWSYIYLLPNVRDKLSPLEVQMTYAISEKAGNLNTRRNSEELKPIIGKSGQMLMISVSVSMFKVAFDLVYHILDLEFWSTGCLTTNFRKPQEKWYCLCWVDRVQTRWWTYFVSSHLYGINLKFQFEIRHPVAI